jgi:hypothetical protein
LFKIYKTWVIYKLPSKTYICPVRNLFKQLFVTYVLLGLIVLGWRWLYQYEISKGAARTGIFRLAMQQTDYPFYATNMPSNALWTGALLGMALLFSLYIYLRREQILSDKWFGWKLACIYILFSIAFALTESPNRLLGMNAHYLTFSNDLSLFTDIPDILANYNAQQKNMDVHGQHYPPGYLICFKLFQQMGWPAGIKWLGLLTAALCIPFIAEVGKKAKLAQTKQQLAMIVIFSFTGFVIYPSLDFKGIDMLLSCASLYYFFKSYHHATKINLFLMGALLAIQGLFNYTVIIPIAFIMAMYIYHFWKTKATLTQIARILGWVSLGFVGFYSTIHLITGFNWPECLLQSSGNHIQQIKIESHWNMTAYLLASFGNVVGILFSMGLLAPFLFIHLNLGLSTTKDIRYIFLVILFIASFSGLFLLETERVWMNLLPLCALSVASALHKLPEKKWVWFIIVALFFNIAQEWYYQHYI